MEPLEPSLTELYEKNLNQRHQYVTYTREEQATDKFRSIEITNFFHGSLVYNDEKIASCLVITNYDLGVFQKLLNLTNGDVSFIKLLYYDPQRKTTITDDMVQGSLKNYFRRNRSSMLTNQDGKICLTNNAKILIRDACKIVYQLHARKIYGVVKSNNFFILEQVEAHQKPTVKLFLDDCRDNENRSVQDYICIRELIEDLYNGDFNTSAPYVQEFCDALRNTTQPYEMFWAHYVFYKGADKQGYLIWALGHDLLRLERCNWNWSSNTDPSLQKAFDVDPEKHSYTRTSNRDLERFVRNHAKHHEGFDFFKLIEKNFPSFWKDLFIVTGYMPLEVEIPWESLTQQQRSGGAGAGAGPSRSRSRRRR